MANYFRITAYHPEQDFCMILDTIFYSRFQKMKKVVYSIRKVRGNSDDKISGLGFLNEEGTLLISIIEQLNL